MTVQTDIELAASLAAGPAGRAAKPYHMGGGGSMAEGFAEEWKFRARANDAIRDVQFAGAITLTAGAGTLQDFQRFGCPQGYFWAIYRLTAYGFSSGTVTAYRDSVNGEPLMPFTVQAVNFLPKIGIILHPMSQLVFSAASISGTATIWGAATQFESWLYPWYVGATRD